MKNVYNNGVAGFNFLNKFVGNNQAQQQNNNQQENNKEQVNNNREQILHGGDLQHRRDHEILNERLFLKKKIQDGRNWHSTESLEKTAKSGVRLLGMLSWNRYFAATSAAYAILSLYNKGEISEKSWYELSKQYGLQLAINMAPTVAACAVSTLCPLIPGIALGVNLVTTLAVTGLDYKYSEYGVIRRAEKYYQLANEFLTPEERQVLIYDDETLLALHRNILRENKMNQNSYLKNLIEGKQIDLEILKSILLSCVSENERENMNEFFNANKENNLKAITMVINDRLDALSRKYKSKDEIIADKMFNESFYQEWEANGHQVALDDLKEENILRMKEQNTECLMSVFNQLANSFPNSEKIINGVKVQLTKIENSVKKNQIIDLDDKLLAENEDQKIEEAEEDDFEIINNQQMKQINEEQNNILIANINLLINIKNSIKNKENKASNINMMKLKQQIKLNNQYGVFQEIVNDLAANPNQAQELLRNNNIKLNDLKEIYKMQSLYLNNFKKETFNQIKQNATLVIDETGAWIGLIQKQATQLQSQNFLGKNKLNLL